MNLYIKPKKVERLGGFLQGKMKKSFLWRAIDAGQVGSVYNELTFQLKELRGSQFVSWFNHTIKIKVNSSAQKQEIILKKQYILGEMEKRGIKAREIKIIFY